MFRASRRPPRQPDLPALKLVTNDGESVAVPAGLSPDLKLRAFFEAYVRPEHLSERAKRTIREYRTTLRYWEQATCDPPLREAAGQITKFREGIKHLGDNTRLKHCVNLQFILDRAGPTLRRDVETAGLLAEVPYVKRPKLVIHDVVDNFSLAEIGWFLDACHAADAPHGLPMNAACFWRASGLFFYNVGLRPQTFLALRWDWLSQDEHGWWLSVPPSAFKTRRGVVLYVNGPAMRVVERMRCCRHERIFPWPHEEAWLHTTRRKILAASQIAEHRRFGFKGFRKACGTQLARINPMAAQLQLGHSGRNVTRDFYVNRQIVASACESLPQPSWCEDFGERQAMLF